MVPTKAKTKLTPLGMRNQRWRRRTNALARFTAWAKVSTPLTRMSKISSVGRRKGGYKSSGDVTLIFMSSSLIKELRIPLQKTELKHKAKQRVSTHRGSCPWRHLGTRLCNYWYVKFKLCLYDPSWEWLNMNRKCVIFHLAHCESRPTITVLKSKSQNSA